MSSVTGPTTETATGREPILICYDDSPDAVRAIEAAAAVLGPRRAVVVDVLPWMTAAQSMAAASSVVPGNAFEELNSAEARRIAGRGAEIGPLGRATDLTGGVPTARRRDDGRRS
jgi:hypothetical protein